MTRLKFIWTSFFMLVAVSHLATSSALAQAVVRVNNTDVNLIAEPEDLLAAGLKTNAATGDDEEAYHRLQGRVGQLQAGLSLALVRVGGVAAAEASPAALDTTNKVVYVPREAGNIVVIDIAGGKSFQVISYGPYGLIAEQLADRALESALQAAGVPLDVGRTAMAREMLRFFPGIAEGERVIVTAVDGSTIQALTEAGLVENDFVKVTDANNQQKVYLILPQTKDGRIETATSQLALAEAAASGEVTFNIKFKRLSETTQNNIKALATKK